MSLFYCKKCEQVTNTMVCYKCGNETEYIIGMDLASGEETKELKWIKVEKPIKE